LRLIEEILPPFILMENVPGIKTDFNNAILSEFLQRLKAKFSLGVARYNIQELSDDENRNNAINDLKMAVPKLKLISKDDSLVEDVEKFIQLKNKEQFNILVNRLRKDLYK